ncbi:hypothetical protein [Nocardioides sp.]|uniref:hypothetical protein n=1 Tax=Nocardioides sp. TaxID=35761 RepID=UPI002B264E67|nr:hypothetical protein [Nocardioides sp.]
MTEPARARHGLGATLKRWRTPIVLLPLFAALVYSGTVGAQMLWGETRATPTASPTVTCWDGTEDTEEACPEPTGVAGLRWVFPSFRPNTDACREVVYEDAGSTGPLEYVCRVRVAGTKARVRYSERSNLQRGLNYFGKRYDGFDPEPVAAGSRLAFRSDEPFKNGTYEVTVAYVEHPFAVTVNAVNERLRDRVLRQSVNLRPARYLSVRPPEDDEA